MKIKEFRIQTGMTQKGFAKYFGIPLRTIQEWEQERKTPKDYWVNLLVRIWEMENKNITKNTEEGNRDA